MFRMIRLSTCVGLLALCAGTAHADVLRCKDGAGHVTYTQGSCPAGTQPLKTAEGTGNGPAPAAPPTVAVTADVSPDETPECPASLTFEGSDADVRACSKSRSLPSTSGWAQLRDRFVAVGTRKRWSGDYLCLKFVEVAQPGGGSRRARPLVTVSGAMRGESFAPGFESPALRGQTFPTKVAAVEAFCAIPAR